LQELRAQQPFRRNRGAADRRVERVELRRHLAQELVDQRPDRAQRMVGRDAGFT
jgi:hypothetical protein